jgi:hypothetical protein
MRLIMLAIVWASAITMHQSVLIVFHCVLASSFEFIDISSLLKPSELKIHLSILVSF